MDTPNANPLEILYNGTRTCDICLEVKAEHEFAYSSVCPHVFCKNCITTNGHENCMGCRTPVPTFTHICQIGSTYVIKVWIERPQTICVLLMKDDGSVRPIVAFD